MNDLDTCFQALTLTFREYQQEALGTDQVRDAGDSRGTCDESLMVPLLGLAGEAGSLLTEYKKWLRQGSIYEPFLDQVSEEIGDILWYLSNIASKMDLDLEEIARENLTKVSDRWGEQTPTQTTLFSLRFDDEYPKVERLPIDYRAEFRMVGPEGNQKMELSFNGEGLGDPLTDNSHESDGYRFHDCFHLGLATILGWSPITRKLLKCKRKSEPAVDEVEDGARASITEEAISVLVYEFAKDYSSFDGASSVEYELLRTIKKMVKPFEVHARSMKEWESAILASYAVWKKLIDNNGGVIVANSLDNQFDYEPLSE